ncbi:DUF2460 domain-containing protein [Aquamicrobium soli]|uniref:DUF2460 domain-containing protein n=1 Tax=Aquamicrobium soli TaxID=1811518 RepID=A0ABV7K739_9HYPH
MVDDPAAILADHLAVGFEGGPAWANSRVHSVSGRTVTNQLRTVPFRNFRFTGAETRMEFLHELLAHFNARQGGLRSFPLKDWSDYKASDEVFGTGDGVETTFGLTKAYGTYVRPIVLPDLSSLVVTVGGSETTAYNFADGRIVFDVAPADGSELRWSGQFYTPVRYAQDELYIRVSAANAAFGTTSALDCYEVMDP